MGLHIIIKIFPILITLGFASSFQSLGATPLPLGTIKPLGWLRSQLQLQATGLATHLAQFWPDVANGTWIGGNVSDPYHLNERIPYWVNGQVVLAALTEDNAVVAQVSRYMDYIMDHQQADGFLAPYDEPPSPPFDYWPRFPVLLALHSYGEAFPQQSPRVQDCLMRFYRALYTRMQKTSLAEWGQYRWVDLALSIYLTHEVSTTNATDRAFLVQLYDLIVQQQFDWEAFFLSPEFPTSATTRSQQTLATHGVNVGQGLKSSAMRWLRDGNITRQSQLLYALSLLDKYHGEANGMFSCSEHLAGNHPSQGTELCTIAETMFSLEVSASIYGNIQALADRLERIAFNALPGAFDPHMWSHNYLSQSNNQFCGPLKPPFIYVSDGGDSNILGLEPNYGCCTANFPQAWPKFVANSWMAQGRSLTALSYVPVSIEYMGATVNVQTDYPFNTTIEISGTLEASASLPLALNLRIPSWASKGSSLSVNGGPAKRVYPGEMHSVQLGANAKLHAILKLDDTLRIERGVRNAAILSRGPLLLSVAMANQWKELKHYAYQSSDWQVSSSSPWNVALDLSQPINLKYVPPSTTAPFDPLTCPLSGTAHARLLPGWKIVNSTCDWPPQSPVTSGYTSPQIVDLQLYGCTAVRISQIPTL